MSGSYAPSFRANMRLSSALARSFGLCCRSCAKKCGFASLWALALAARARFRGVLGALGAVSGGQNACISVRLGCVRAFGAYFVRWQQNTVKNGTERTSALSRDTRTRIKIRVPNALARVRRCGRAPSPLPRATGASQDRSERVWGRVLGRPGAATSALGPPLARLGALLGGLGRVRRRPLSDPDRFKPPKMAPKSIFGRFRGRFLEFCVRSGVVVPHFFERCFFDFRSVFGVVSCACARPCCLALLPERCFSTSSASRPFRIPPAASLRAVTPLHLVYIYIYISFRRFPDGDSEIS